MIRFSYGAAFSLAFSMAAMSAHAADPVPVDMDSAAKKICETRLEQDRFTWNTMEQCVDDQSAKLLRARKASVAVPQAAAGAKSANPS